MPNIIEITDFESPELDIYARLSEGVLLNRHEPEKGIFIAESPKVIERALDAGYEPISILSERKHVEGEAKDIIVRCGEIPIYTAELEVLTKLTGFQLTRGLLCAMHRPKLPSVEEVCAGARRIAVLENVMNPTNVGAIFRSAAALNIDAVLLTPASSNPLYRRAIRVSMGTVFQVPWTFFEKELKHSHRFNKNTLRNNFDSAELKSQNNSDSSGLKLPNNIIFSNGNEDSDKINHPSENTQAENTQSYIRKLQGLGFKTAAMALSDDSVSIDNPQLMAEEKLAIVLGTEGDGLASSTISDCDYTVRIPMSHGVDSLNVAAASAVAFWQLGNRQRVSENCTC